MRTAPSPPARISTRRYEKMADKLSAIIEFNFKFQKISCTTLSGGTSSSEGSEIKRFIYLNTVA